MTETKTSQSQAQNPLRAHIEMLHSLADGIDGLLVASTYFAAGGTGPITHHPVGDIDGMVDAIEAHLATPGANSYVGLQVMRRGLERGKRGTESDIVAVLGLVADMDADTGNNAGDYPLPPNYIVESSAGNFQAFWLFDKPVKPDVAKGIAAGLRAATGSDHCTADVAHVWRVPGTLNHPNATKLSRGRSPEPQPVTVAQPWDGTFTDPTALALAVAGYANTVREAKTVELGELPSVDGIEVSPGTAELLAADDVGDRSAHAARVAEQLGFDGHTAEEAAALFLAATGNWTARYRDADAMRRDFERLWGKFGPEDMAPYMEGVKKLRLPKPANDNQPEPVAPEMHPDPFTPEAAGGLLGDIAQWVTSTAIVPVPELSLSAAIALMGGLFGGKALTPTDAGVNVYITTLMDTAGGKGHPPKAIRQIAAGLGAAGTNAVTNGDHTSYAAIERTLRKCPSTAIIMDEFGLTLQDINAKNRNSVAASIRKFLLAVYDQSNSMFDGRIYASAETKKDAEPIAGPALTVLGMTTTETLYAGLSEASVSDGFLNRFLFVTAGRVDEIRPPSLKRALRVPKDLSEALKAAIAEFPKADKGLSIRKHTVPMEGGEDGPAYALWAEIFRWQNDRFWRGDARNIIGRAAENTIRLATLRAISRCPAKPAVSRDDVAWGWGVVHASITAIRDGVRRHMSESPADKLRKAIIVHVEEAGEGGLPYSKLLEKRGVMSADKRQLSDALEWLVAAGQVQDVNGRTAPGKGSKFVRTLVE